MLPNKNGFDILSDLRKNNITSKIIMLTALSSLENKIDGFNKGTDDYLTKPFHIEELIVRINKQLNLINYKISYEDIYLDKSNKKLINEKTNESVDLVCKEYKLLEYLINNQIMILSKEQIYDKVWGIENESESNNIEAYMSFLRKKLKAIASSVTIKSYRNLGYKLEAQNNDRKDEPFEKIVSDTTSFYFKGKKYDWTFYLDMFNNEIVGLDVRETMYGNGILNHKKAVENMLNNKIKRGYKDLDTIVHIDQGIIYSSVSFKNIFNSYNITRSMSRAGTPTDNLVIESKNGWLNKEMYIDFDVNNYNTVKEFIDDIIWDNNNYRPSYALNYKNPIEYRTQLGFQ